MAVDVGMNGEQGMAGGFRVLEDIALADSAFEAWGDSLPELFECASQALIQTMVTPSTVGDSLQKELILEDFEIPELLFEWLSRMVFFKDAEALLFQKVHCQVWNESEKDVWHVRGTLIGAPIDPATQELHTDVKAITKHLYDVRQEGTHWVATIVLDV